MNVITLTNAYVHKKQIRNLQDGKKVANLSVVIKEYNPSSKNEDKKDSLWFQVNVWGKSADFVDNYIKPESYVNIKGKLQENFYRNKEGNEVKIYSVFCETIEPCYSSKKKESNDDYRKPTQNQYKNQQDDFEDDDIPF